MNPVLSLREAHPEEAPLLSELAMRSKAHWGYSDTFMETCRAELTVSPKQIQADRFHTVVAELVHQVVGFYSIEQMSPSQFELEALFVDPEHIGTGIGQALITDAKVFIQTAGGCELLIQGDPHAEPFYRAVGAYPIGARESDSIPGRVLPLFLLIVTKN